MALPLALVRTTSTVVPGTPAGTSQKTEMSLTTVTLVAAAPPMVTLGWPAPLFWKPVPERVMVFPAVAGPLDGTRLDPVVHRNEFWFAWQAFFGAENVFTG